MIGSTLLTHAQILAVDIQVNPSPPPGSDKFMMILSWIGWGACIAAVAALLIAGGLFGHGKRQGTMDNEATEKVRNALIGCVIIAVAGGLVGALTG